MDLVSLFLAPDWDNLAFEDALDHAAPGDVDAILDLVTSDDAEVRLHLAQNLPRLSRGEPPTPRMLRTAIALTEDPDIAVRDWACFALGTQWAEVDTPELRDALAERLDDASREARSEALLGLALRRDPRAVGRVRDALSRASGVVYASEMRAAAALGDPGLHALVLAHQAGWDDEEAALDAMAASRLTDPQGPGDDLLDGVAELSRRRARGKPDGDALASWQVMSTVLDRAPHRAGEFLDEVVARLGDDEAAVREIRERSALATMATEPD
ncbi:HEAT repeat domain-containing protein [Cellulomonas sp. PhB150]|uniref:HEAT repeat domain-containing protein n=1 Tax=Cellulomonas sp. PhB150 TaxID=2485188 RepID=UPI000F464F83|nr:HEAT repeat domain-containing protein [Cellulomonas sp. PhB150]ROS23091.1 HEAT repeat protein [Cellulomonas sp. PhB150]